MPAMIMENDSNQELFERFEELARMNLRDDLAEGTPEDGLYREMLETYKAVRKELLKRLTV
jgi:hypothetical protein